MSIRLLRKEGLIKVTDVSVIPCRLIGGLHEWLNESATVPAWKPVK